MEQGRETWRRRKRRARERVVQPGGECRLAESPLAVAEGHVRESTREAERAEEEERGA